MNKNKAVDLGIRKIVDTAHEHGIVLVELDDGIESAYIRENLLKIQDGSIGDDFIILLEPRENTDLHYFYVVSPDNVKRHKER